MHIVGGGRHSRSWSVDDGKWLRDWCLRDKRGSMIGYDYEQIMLSSILELITAFLGCDPKELITNLLQLSCSR